MQYIYESEYMEYRKYQKYFCKLENHELRGIEKVFSIRNYIASITTDVFLKTVSIRYGHYGDITVFGSGYPNLYNLLKHKNADTVRAICEVFCTHHENIDSKVCVLADNMKQDYSYVETLINDINERK